MDPRAMALLTERLRRRPDDDAAWRELGRHAVRQARLPVSLFTPAHLQALRELLAQEPGERPLATLVLAMQGLESLPNGPARTAPGWWWRESGRLVTRDGEDYDRETGMPLRARIAGSGVELAWVPGGGFGMSTGKACGSRSVRVDDLWLGRRPVTVEQAAGLVDTGELSPPPEWDRQRRRPQRPVVGLTHEAARRLASLLGGRLPSEAEWEKGARGPGEAPYPWGHATFTAERANLWFDPAAAARELAASVPEPGRVDGDRRLAGAADPGSAHIDDPAPTGAIDFLARPPPAIHEWDRYLEDAGSRPLGASAYGAFDMLGNVFEWCEDDWDERFPSQGVMKNPRGALGFRKVVRGGSWRSLPVRLGADRTSQDPATADATVGLRLARSISCARP